MPVMPDDHETPATRATPTMRFAVLTDAHIGATTANRWHNRFLTDHPEETLAATVAAVNHEAPDFTIVTGDLSDTAGDDELSRARDVLNGLDAPWIVCRGNHDQHATGSNDAFARAFGDRAPVGVVGADHLPLPENIAMVVLDADWGRDGDTWRVWIPDDQVTAAVDALSERSDVPDLLIVACHFPLVRQGEYIRSRDPEGKNAGTIWEGEQVLETLASRAARTLCFTGHQHFHHITTQDGWPNWLHCTTASLAEYPAEFRLVTIDDRGVDIRTLPGAPDVVAANPPSVMWVHGRDEDREFRWAADTRA